MKKRCSWGWRPVVALVPIVLLPALGMLPSTALGYSSPRSFALEATVGGGGGRYFTGAPNDAYDCSVCHVAAGNEAAISVRGLSDPIEAGSEYEVEISWKTDLKGFSLNAEVFDVRGHRAGVFGVIDSEAVDSADLCVMGTRATMLADTAEGRTIVQTDDCGAMRARFLWTAPEVGEPPAYRFQVAGIATNRDAGPFGDQPAFLSVELSRPDLGQKGCSMTNNSKTINGFGLGLGLLGMSLFRRRRSPWRRAVPKEGSVGQSPRFFTTLCVAIVVGLCVSACAPIPPATRGRLAQPDMRVGGASRLMAGPEHALEYREGAVGGRGAGGGGCGCG